MDQAILRFEVSKSTLYTWLRQGRLKRYKREGDRRTFISRAALAKLREFREEE